MLVALTDQKSGNSTPRCSKLIEPSRQLVMTTSRRSHVTASYGCRLGLVWPRSSRSPRARRVLRAVPPSVLTVSVMYLVLSATTYQRFFGRGSSSIRSVFRSFFGAGQRNFFGRHRPRGLLRVTWLRASG